MYQTPLRDLRVYVSPGVYSDGSPVMLYRDGMLCGPAECSVTLGDTGRHAAFGAPVERPCATEAKATTADNTSRAVFMAQGLYNSLDGYCVLLYQH